MLCQLLLSTGYSDLNSVTAKSKKTKVLNNTMMTIIIEGLKWQ